MSSVFSAVILRFENSHPVLFLANFLHFCCCIFSVSMDWVENLNQHSIACLNQESTAAGPISAGCLLFSLSKRTCGSQRQLFLSQVACVYLYCRNVKWLTDCFDFHPCFLPLFIGFHTHNWGLGKRCALSVIWTMLKIWLNNTRAFSHCIRGRMPVWTCGKVVQSIQKEQDSFYSCCVSPSCCTAGMYDVHLAVKRVSHGCEKVFILQGSTQFPTSVHQKQCVWVKVVVWEVCWCFCQPVRAKHRCSHL